MLKEEIKKEDIVEMTDGEREKYYDSVIAPRLTEVAIDAAKHGMSVIALAQFNDNTFGEISVFLPNINETFKAVWAILQKTRAPGR